MEQSEVNVLGHFACPDKEQSGEGKIWPEFWTRNKLHGRLLKELTLNT